MRCLTWYDYRTRFGAAGRLSDRAVFRPLIGWATAWSFDRLRLWIERGIPPAVALRSSLIYASARLALAFIWIYHGLVPKLLLQHPDELALLVRAGVSPAAAPALVRGLGVGGIALGLALPLPWRSRRPLLATIALMLLATAGVGWPAPPPLVAAVHPLTLQPAGAAPG